MGVVSASREHEGARVYTEGTLAYRGGGGGCCSARYDRLARAQEAALLWGDRPTTPCSTAASTRWSREWIGETDAEAVQASRAQGMARRGAGRPGQTGEVQGRRACGSALLGEG